MGSVRLSQILTGKTQQSRIHSELRRRRTAGVAGSSRMAGAPVPATLPITPTPPLDDRFSSIHGRKEPQVELPFPAEQGSADSKRVQLWRGASPIVTGISGLSTVGADEPFTAYLECVSRRPHKAPNLHLHTPKDSLKDGVARYVYYLQPLHVAESQFRAGVHMCRTKDSYPGAAGGRADPSSGN